jgi:hypothetical protein
MILAQRSVLLALLTTTLACSPSLPSQGLYPRPRRTPRGALCYSGLGAIYPPFAAAHEGVKPVQSWLVLAALPDTGSGYAYSVWEDGRGQAGGWSRMQDGAIRVHLRDSFTHSTLRLMPDSTGLTGEGEGTTDVMQEDSAGTWRPAHHTWSAHVKRSSCGSVPRPDDVE